MCSIIGGFASDANTYLYLSHAWRRSAERGSDSWGIASYETPLSLRGSYNFLYTQELVGNKSPSGTRMIQFVNDKDRMFVGYRRGTPSHEWHQDIDDTQPFTVGEWTIVHNGTISNDAELWETVKQPGETPQTAVDSWIIAYLFDKYGFFEAVKRLEGSFAILAMKHGEEAIYYATNYKPLFACTVGPERDVIFASQKKYLDSPSNPLAVPQPVEIGPYEMGKVLYGGPKESRYPYFAERRSLYLPHARGQRRKVLVVCSGGLDSGTVAWIHHESGDDVTLLHFRYGARATGPEVFAVESLALAMECETVYLDLDFYKRHTHSPLTTDGAPIAQGRTGAEFAHEWVPARNTVMLSLSLAYAEANGYDVIALGSNQEESCGGYPDNEQEFVNKFRALTPYAVKPYKRIEFSDMFAGSMKHDIVRSGEMHKMPFDLTWSCYRGGPKHCGNCGPCSMRRLAFQHAGVVDPTEYKEDLSD